MAQVVFPIFSAVFGAAGWTFTTATVAQVAVTVVVGGVVINEIAHADQQRNGLPPTALLQAASLFLKKKGKESDDESYDIDVDAIDVRMPTSDADAYKIRYCPFPFFL